MNINTIAAVRAEIETALKGRKFGKIFQLSRSEAAIDFRLKGSLYLFISTAPADPRVYLIRRRLRDLERTSGNLSPFMMYVRKRLTGAELVAIEQIEGERVLVFNFAGWTESGERQEHSLTVQLTGRSANLFLLDEDRRILEASRETKGEGQQPGDVYQPPARGDRGPSAAYETAGDVPLGRGPTISEELDRFYLEKEAEREFRSLAAAARAKLDQETAKRERLAERLKADLREHGDAEKWKRFGDLLLANTSTAERSGESVIVTDYFADGAPRISIETGRDRSVTEAAENFFRRYTRSRNAGTAIAKRLEILEGELRSLEAQKEKLAAAVSERDIDILNQFAGRRSEPNERKPRKQKEQSSAVRQFTSSDGFEILVGKKAKDNDLLTFRMAKSLDLWMHAADYPGSHVVVRNPSRGEVPQRTLIEAAQLAAFYSQGKTQPKAAVHYTQKKFVNKPRGAAPGLVSLASFKTILVEPQVPDFENGSEN